MLTFELVTLDGVKFGDEVYEVMLPTPDGQIAIFPEHIPLVSLAVPGIITIRRRKDDDDKLLEYYAVNGGVVEINGRRVRVLVDEADNPDEISEQKAAEALERAKEATKNAGDEVSLEQAHSMIQRYRSQLKVAELKRNRGSRGGRR